MTTKSLNEPFAIITATREIFGDGRSNRNLQLNTALAAYLNQALINYESCTGYYNGIDQGESFFIPSITPGAALDIARLFSQEAIVTHRGLEFADGRPTLPPAGTLTGEAARATGNHTVFACGLCWALTF
jgi:hypothetical protein